MVSHFVIFEARLGTEADLADITAKRLLAAMRPPVVLKMVLPPELLSAELARERPLTGVRQHVPTQVHLRTKLTTAIAAGVLPRR